MRIAPSMVLLVTPLVQQEVVEEEGCVDALRTIILQLLAAAERGHRGIGVHLLVLLATHRVGIGMHF